AVDRGVRPLPPGPQGAAEARHRSSSLRPGDDPPRSVRDRPRAPRGRSEPAQRIAHASTPASMKLLPGHPRVLLAKPAPDPPPDVVVLARHTPWRRLHVARASDRLPRLVPRRRV